MVQVAARRTGTSREGTHVVSQLHGLDTSVVLEECPPAALAADSSVAGSRRGQGSREGSG